MNGRTAQTPPPRQTVERVLTAALSGLGWGKPYNSVYQGKASRYIVINHTDTPELCGDDLPEVIVARVQVHLYAPLAENILPMERAVKRALFAAGTTWPTREDASDGESRHIVMECEMAVEAELDGND